MFHPIKERLAARLARLAATNTVATKIRQVAAGFIASASSSPLAHRISYDPREHEVTVIAGSRSDARDLLLRTHQLSALFREHGLKVSRIIIR